MLEDATVMTITSITPDAEADLEPLISSASNNIDRRIYLESHGYDILSTRVENTLIRYWRSREDAEQWKLLCEATLTECGIDPALHPMEIRDI